jgi:hypothetical protein
MPPRILRMPTRTPTGTHEVSPSQPLPVDSFQRDSTSRKHRLKTAALAVQAAVRLKNIKPFTLKERFLRCLSNLLRTFKLAFKCAKRRYHTISGAEQFIVNSTEKTQQEKKFHTLAQKHCPKLSALHPERRKKWDLQIRRILYEILPPSVERPDELRVIYYIKARDERHPNPFFRALYNKFVRSVLWGSKHDFEAVQLSINLNTLEPCRLFYETTLTPDDDYNYLNTKTSNFHITREIELKEGTWKETLNRKNGKQTNPLKASPFNIDGSPHFTIVSWNGALEADCLPKLQKHPKYFFAKEPKLEELKPEQFKRYGFDLRTPWLNAQKYAEATLEHTRLRALRKHPDLQAG